MLNAISNIKSALQNKFDAAIDVLTIIFMELMDRAFIQGSQFNQVEEMGSGADEHKSDEIAGEGSKEMVE